MRLASSCWASPIGTGDRVYLFGKDVTTTVLSANRTPEKLAVNRLPTDTRVYGVAALENSFLTRAGNHLTRVSSTK